MQKGCCIPNNRSTKIYVFLIHLGPDSEDAVKSMGVTYLNYKDPGYTGQLISLSGTTEHLVPIINVYSFLKTTPVSTHVTGTSLCVLVCRN